MLYIKQELIWRSPVVLSVELLPGFKTEWTSFNLKVLNLHVQSPCSFLGCGTNWLTGMGFVPCLSICSIRQLCAADAVLIKLFPSKNTKVRCWGQSHSTVSCVAAAVFVLWLPFSGGSGSLTVIYKYSEVNAAAGKSLQFNFDGCNRLSFPTVMEGNGSPAKAAFLLGSKSQR